MTVRSLLSVISVALTLVSGPKSHAQDKLILLTESDRNYRSQTWFYSGAGNELQEDKIKANWDEDRRITSAAHTDKGWFVTMAKDTGIGRQSYHYGKDWPGDWLEEKSAQNYCITTIASNRSKWFIVMSQGTGYTAQKRFGCTNWSENADRIKALWNEGYYITQATYTGDKWYIVMSRDCGYCAQGYLWASTYDRLKEKIKAKWDEDYNVTLIEYGAGEYFAVYSKYSAANNVAQSYRVLSDSPSDYIDRQWSQDKQIAYVGGGYAERPNAGNTSTTGNAGNAVPQPTGNGQRTWRQTLPNGGYCDHVMNPDGSGTSTTVMPCTWCHGTKICPICGGQGGICGYGGTWYPCKSCCGSRICQNCKGTGFTTLVSTFQNGVAIGYDNNGRVYTGGGSGSGLSSSSGSFSSGSGSSGSGSSSRSNDYIETIEYAPNYTGEDNSEYCPVCGKVAPKHVHIKKRY